MVVVGNQALGVNVEFVFSLSISEVLYELLVVAFAEEYLLAVVTAAGDVVKAILALKPVGSGHTLILSENLRDVKSFHISRADPLFCLFCKIREVL